MSDLRTGKNWAEAKATFAARHAHRVLAVLALVAGALASTGCAPKVWAANALQPSEPGDTKEVWIYLHTDDADIDGVYRCYDGDQKPVCKRAMLITK